MRRHRPTPPTPDPGARTTRHRPVSRPALTRLSAVGACAGTAVTSALIGPAARR